MGCMLSLRGLLGITHVQLSTHSPAGCRAAVGPVQWSSKALSFLFEKTWNQPSLPLSVTAFWKNELVIFLSNVLLREEKKNVN